MVDPHQMHSLIAAAISECRKNHPKGEILGEEAKVMAKCVVQQLADAGYHIEVSANKGEASASDRSDAEPANSIHG